VAVVEGDAHHHLFRVRRLQVGDELRVVDGRGVARAARIESVSKLQARLLLGAPAAANEPELAVELYVAVPKPENAAWLVEKATEIGVKSIAFVSTDREARALTVSQLERLRRIAVSAVEQCGRSWLPPVGDGGDLRAVVSRTRDAAMPLVVLDGSGAAARPAMKAGGPIAVFVGPEGGWSEEELAMFAAERLPLWALGPTVLRVETAAVAAAVILIAG
jgi:16S rRNA (uracil1498-N3)-methyltransferase